MKTIGHLDLELIRSISNDLELHGTALIEPSIVFCRGDFMISWNADVPYYPACLIKVPICVAIYTLLESGKIHDAPVTIQDEAVTESVYPSPLIVGHKTTIEELVHYALYYSDNTAANVLMDLAEREQLNAVLRGIGLKQTAVRRHLVGATVKPDRFALGRNAHSAADAATLLSLLCRRAVPGADKILAHLRHDALPELGFFGLSPTDALHYKDGYTSSVTHLGAIVGPEEGDPYVCVVYTNLPFSPDNYGKITAFFRQIRSLVNVNE